MHAKRLVSDGRVHGSQPCDVYGFGSVPRGRDLKPRDGDVLEPERCEWNGLQRRQRLHAKRLVSGRRVHGIESRDVHSIGSVPRRRDMQSGQRHVLEPERGEWNRLQRRQRLYADG